MDSTTSTQQSQIESNSSNANESEEILSEISEHISLPESISSAASPTKSIPIIDQIATKKRQLFNMNRFDDEDDEDLNVPMTSSSKFKIDDTELDIASHFKVEDEIRADNREPRSISDIDELSREVAHDEDKPMHDLENIEPEINIPYNIDQDNISLNPEDSLDDVLKDLQSDCQSEYTDNKSAANSKIMIVSQMSDKEISPMQEDVILINNNKVSLNSLKNLCEDPVSDRTNQNTTNDISDIGIDENSGALNDLLMIIGSTFRANLSEIKSKSVEISKCRDPIEQRNYKSLELENNIDKMERITFEKSEAPPFSDDSVEEDHSIEEMIVSNASIEEIVETSGNKSNTFKSQNIGEMGTEININNESLVNRIISDTITSLPHEIFSHRHNDSPEPDSLEINSDDMAKLKETIIQNASTIETKLKLVRNYSLEENEQQQDDDDIQISDFTKPMEKLEYSKEVLDDISEESDLLSIKHLNDISELQKIGQEFRKILENTFVESNDLEMNQKDTIQPNSFESVISLNMLQQMENKIRELEEIVAAKDVCLNGLNMQLDSYSRRDSLRTELPPSARESSSLATSSTEYRTYQDDYGNKVFDYHTELADRENLIEQLTESLQQSIQKREQLQYKSDEMTQELTQLRKQLFETNELLKRPHWMRDHDSVGGQRISEISIDLVSESGGGSEKNMTDADGSNRDSRERQLLDELIIDEPPHTTLQMEQFQKFLSNDEQRIFYMIQSKFNEFLTQELEKLRCKSDGEMKKLTERIETEKQEKEIELNRLRHLLANVKNGSPELIELKRELEGIHGREMENLRTYFERKCADLEKQYSEEVFSQHSRRHSNDTASELSEEEEDLQKSFSNEEERKEKLIQNSPKRHKSKSDLLASPTHRKITPTSIGDLLVSPRKPTDKCIDESDPVPTIPELHSFYRDKISEITKNHEDTVRMLKFRLKRFETKNADDEYMSKSSNNGAAGTSNSFKDGADNVDITNNDSNALNEIAREYDRRLEAQLAMAKDDMVQALEEQIQALLSETATDDGKWPAELILLREKFTAKSQLEIAQLQIKHKEEMDRLKTDYDKQLTRKLKRQTTFDINRDIDTITLDRDNLRELCFTFRSLLSQLAKCISVCEIDLNNTLFDELHKHGIDTRATNDVSLDSDELNHLVDNSHHSNVSFGSKPSKHVVRFAPNVSGILSVIEDPMLVSFVGEDNKDGSFNLTECVDKLRQEANCLLELSENLCTKNQKQPICGKTEKDDSCEEEDGLKTAGKRVNKYEQTVSLNENLVNGRSDNRNIFESFSQRTSLPTNCLFDPDEKIKSSEMNVQLNELKNRLTVSETERKNLASELADAVRKHDNLAQILCMAKDHLEHLESQKEDISEGYAISQLQSPSRQLNASSKSTYSDLQNTARSILNGATVPNTSSTNGSNEDSTNILQQIEDFCGKLDRFVEEEKRNKNDLQEQNLSKKSKVIIIGQRQVDVESNVLKIDAAYKHKKATGRLLEQQAFEWQQERDDFTKEIDRLNIQLRDREKECLSYGRVVKEVEIMEQQIREMTVSISSYEDKKQKLEVELKASIDKIFVLREIIAELEQQIETKSFNELALSEKVKNLENYVNAQSHTNESLHDEVESLKIDIASNYQEKIAQLEEQLRQSRPSAEQSLVIEQMATQLKQIESSLDRKTRTLESLHSNIGSVSCSSPSEDVSIKGLQSNINSPIESPRSPTHSSLPVDDVQRILDKLIKHNRAEEAAIKRIRDLEMQITGVRTNYAELQHERDVLQEKMTEQISRITTLQSRLDEQRHRAEELHRQGTSDLNLKVYDLQSQLTILQEKLTAREKQIVTLKDHLEQSRIIIDRLEADLAVASQMPEVKNDEKIVKLENENKMLKEKIRNEMIIKSALPDLMETILDNKNDEIDHLRERLDDRQKQLQMFLDLNLDDRQIMDLQKNAKEMCDGKLSGRTLSDIVSLSEYDEPDIIRKESQEDKDILSVGLFSGINDTSQHFFTNQEDSTKPKFNITTQSLEPTPMQSIHFMDQLSMGTPQPAQPRQINFSIPDELTSAEQKPISYIMGMPSSNIDEAELKQQDTTPTEQRLLEKETEIESLKVALEAVVNEKFAIDTKLKLKSDNLQNLQLDFAEKDKLLVNVLAEKEKIQQELNEIQNKLEKVNVLQAEIELMEQQLVDKTEQIDKLSYALNEKCRAHDLLNGKLSDYNEISEKNQKLNEQNEIMLQQVESLNRTISHKDELLSKHDKNSLNSTLNEAKYLEQINALEQQILDINRGQQFQQQSPTDYINFMRLQRELDDTKNDLYEKMIDFEKCKLDLKANQQTIDELKDLLADSKSPRSVEEMRTLIRFEQDKNTNLQNELDALRESVPRQDNSGSPKPFSLDEIAERVEKELNYSAQLDSNILKAIESDELNSDDDNFHKEVESNELQALKQKYEIERQNCLRLQRLLDSEKLNSSSVQETYADMIETMRKRLEVAVTQETEMQKRLDDEHLLTERLQAQISVYQRNALKSPHESPRRSQRNTDAESEQIARLQSEIKLLSAQNERERERVMDIERVVDREKNRFEKELSDRRDYEEQIKREMDRMFKEKEHLENELENTQEQLSISQREIENLETRLTNLKEAETVRAQRRGKERLESTQNVVDAQELKIKLCNVEKERDDLQTKVAILHGDIERSAQRELKLTAALVKEHSPGEGVVPTKFLQQLNNMNNLIVDNSKENRQMAETLQFLTEERHQLQQKLAEMELRNRAFNREELEERANHLFGKYLRVESFRKGLVHQKRYLVLVLRAYQEQEAQALASLKKPAECTGSKRIRFKTVALAVIAIERMKYIVRRWHTGKRVGTQAIFSYQLPKRSASATTNNWIRSVDSHHNNQSTSSRDRPPPYSNDNNRSLLSPSTLRPLQAPHLIVECSERLERMTSRQPQLVHHQQWS